MQPCCGDTKPLCYVAHACVAFLVVSIAHMGGDKALVLCQPESQSTLLACFSRRRRGSPVYLGRAVPPSPQTRGAIAVLERLGMFRTTKSRQSLLIVIINVVSLP